MFNRWVSRLEKKITQISDQAYTPVFFSFEHLLVMASVIFQACSGLRLKLYQRGVFKSRHLPCTVISIGNIVAGGVGKTPMAICLAELLTAMGKRTVVISRGYKGSLKSGAKIVSDGRTVFLDAQTAGDEPYMMACRKTFPVVVGKDRYTAGMLAIERLNPDIIVLDDAFQHVKLKRNLDILLLDHDRPLGNHRMLPAGRLRETLSMARQRVHAIAFTRCPKTDRKKVPGIMGQFGPVPFFETCHTPFVLKYLPSKKSSVPAPDSPDVLKDRNCLLFSGIANNPSVKQTAAALGVNVMDHLEFIDHYRYKRADILRIQKRARDIGTDLIITTEKDWVKIDPQTQWCTDLAVISIRIDFADAQGFKNFVLSRITN